MFVNEYLSGEEKAKRGFYKWTIDREKGAYLRCLKTEGKSESCTFELNAETDYLIFRTDFDVTDEENSRIKYTIAAIHDSNIQHRSKSEMLDLAEQALKVFGYSGLPSASQEETLVEYKDLIQKWRAK